MNGLIRYTRPAELFDWNRMLDSFYDNVPVWNTRTPAVDVKEEETRYLMEVELPGLTDKDVELKVEDNILTLSSKKEESKEETKNGYLLRERRSAEFCRTFVLPRDTDRAEIKAEFKNGYLLRERRSAEFCRTFVLPRDSDRAEIKAEFKNGLLVVNVPKKPEAQPRKIDVKFN